MKLTFEMTNTTNLEAVIAYLVGQGAVVTEKTKKEALATQHKQVFLEGIKEGMRLLAEKQKGKKVDFQTAKDLLSELD